MTLLNGAAPRSDTAQQSDELNNPRATYDDLARLRQLWHGPLLVKGVLTAKAARDAVDCGADGIIVSNHGGRQLDGAPATIDVLGEKKKGEAPKVEVELKLTKDSKQIFVTAGPGMAQVMAGLTASIWVNPNTKNTVAVGVFQTKKQEAQTELSGKVVATAEDGRSFTLLIPPTKTKAGEEVAPGKEVKVALADAARIIFVNVASGGARITNGYSARVILAEGSKETAATVILSGE